MLGQTTTTRNQQSRKKWGNFEKQHPNTAPSFTQDDSSTGEVSDSVYIKGIKKEGHGALKVKPKKGSAIVFWHDYPGSSGYSAGDSLAWHTGCK